MKRFDPAIAASIASFNVTYLFFSKIDYEPLSPTHRLEVGDFSVGMLKKKLQLVDKVDRLGCEDKKAEPEKVSNNGIFKEPGSKDFQEQKSYT